MKARIPKICSRVWEKLRQEDGQDAIEYVLAAGLCAMLAVSGAKSIATHINGAFVNVGSNFTTALNGGGGGNQGGDGGDHGGNGGGGDHGGNGGGDDGGNGGHGGNGGGGDGGGGNGGGGHGGHGH